MGNFRNTFMAENRERLLTPADLLRAIKQYDNEDEIMNADFNHIKEQAGYRFRDFMKPLEIILDGLRQDNGERYVYPHDSLDDLRWSYPTSMASLKKFEKALKAVPNEYSKVKAVGQSMLDDWQPIIDGLKALKPKIVKASQKREEAQKKAEKAMNNKRLDSKVMIDLLEDHRKEYINEAKKRAKTYLDGLLKKLKESDWNIDELVPRNARSEGSRQMRALYTSITEPTNYSRSFKDPLIVKKSTKKEKLWIEMQIKGAEMNYDSFINKMVEKIGEPVIEATMKGSIWTNATLDVVTASGESQTWTTKIILNFSKFGKMFNQFPSRKKK